ncbi:MAG TPA: c-type cytochrome [Vicinamibacteria bacterium]|nr:c-type cytochrome [Vicinamibacteria bacterium]
MSPALLYLVLAAAAEGAPRTTQDGVYTSRQAERGRENYQQACAGCHALEWYRGDVMKPWEGAPLSSLYDAMATTMPQNNPGSLKRREYLDLLAYILSLNEMPTGSEELPASTDDLKKILVKRRSKP